MPTRSERANAIRALSMDAVQRANSGHPGAPMGMADIAEVLWNDLLVHNPGNPQWANRDRFVMSNGHASMLLYSLLHLSGYPLPIEELKNFRQLHSKTPGHPEYGEAPGVETTTGPLGQGLGNAVGMALAEKVLGAHFNLDGFAVIDHFTYAFCGDGCLMEGVSHEVCSLAGTLGLGKLIVCYDDNGISIDGRVGAWFSDDTAARFRAYGWQVVEGVDGHNAEAVSAALTEARVESSRPSLICCRTVIGKGAPNKADSESVHGSALGTDEVAATRAALGWAHEAFVVPQELYEDWNACSRGHAAERAWQDLFDAYQGQYPELAGELMRRLAGELPAHFEQHLVDHIASVDAAGQKLASRKASENTLNALGPLLPELLGGSADLTVSNLTWWRDSKPVSAADPDGNYIFYGVREFGMGAIMNGLCLHGGFRPYGGTFLIFMEYMRNSVRMASLMRLPVTYVYTHDSIGMGEDGPTHQPIEQLTALRATPNMSVWRPCDAVETAVAWREAVRNLKGPTALVLSRQGLEHQVRDDAGIAAIALGAYVLRDCTGLPELIIIATGSEVGIAFTAWQQLTEAGHQVRLVSMPSCDRFESQTHSYRESVLPSTVRARIAVEAGHEDFWRKYVGLDGRVIGMQSFGASAPGDALMTHFGFTAERIIEQAGELLA